MVSVDDNDDVDDDVQCTYQVRGMVSDDDDHDVDDDEHVRCEGWSRSRCRKPSSGRRVSSSSGRRRR